MGAWVRIHKIVSLKAISSVGLGTYYSLRGWHRLLMETGTCTEQHFPAGGKVFRAFSKQRNDDVDGSSLLS
jgi:hypothetical protein